MSSDSRIEWTERTWNPVVGCTKVSPGCKHCYAETMARRLQAMGMKGYERGFRLTLMPERLDEPLRRRKPTVYFVNSMSDLFHEEVPFGYVDEVFDVMNRAYHHTFQVLTKRARRMAAYCEGKTISPNVWIGVSVENKTHGKPRIDVLRDIDATVRFLSIEPLLEDVGALDLTGIHWSLSVVNPVVARGRSMLIGSRLSNANAIERMSPSSSSNGVLGAPMARGVRRRLTADRLGDESGMGCRLERQGPSDLSSTGCREDREWRARDNAFPDPRFKP